MSSIKSLDVRYELVAWGITLILVGCLSAIPSVPGTAGVTAASLLLPVERAQAHLPALLACTVTPLWLVLGNATCGLVRCLVLTAC